MNKKLHLTVVSYLIITFLVLLLGVFLLTRKDSSYEQVVINYKEAGNPIDYKVYLKKNNFFETDYLDEGVTYISSLIDYIDVDFKYKSSFFNCSLTAAMLSFVILFFLLYLLAFVPPFFVVVYKVNNGRSVFCM